ncbi:MAG: phosphatase PAP2 family protein [Gemmatimonadota bacterium]
MSTLRPSRTAIALFALFGLVATLMATGVTATLDDTALRIIGSWRTPERTNWMLAFTLAGDGSFEVPMALGIALLLWRLGARTQAMRYVQSGVVGELLYLALKWAFHRPRPSVIPRLGEAGWYSFPSGHTMMAPILWTTGFLLLARLATNRVTAGALAVIGLAAPLLIGGSRLYLGVHYPSDVLGALLVGSAWVCWWWPSAGSDASSVSTSAAPAIR